MKRWVTIMAAGMLAAGLSVSAFAASPQRGELAAQKREIAQNRQELRELQQENRALRETCRTAKQEQKTAGTLTDETRDELERISALLKEERAVLAGSKGEGKELKLLAKEKKRTGELAAASDAWGQAVETQEERLEAKREIHDLLEEKSAVL